MDYNKTKRERQLSMASSLALKMVQEKKLKEKLKPHFERLGRQVKTHYVDKGKLPSFDIHKKAVGEIINDHYIDTATKFSTTIRDNFQPVKNNTKVQALINTHIEHDANDRSEFSSNEIANTTSDNFKDYIKETIAIAAATEILLSKKEIADNIYNKFTDTTEGRLDIIAGEETGIAAHDGKFDEIDALDDASAEFEDGTSVNDYAQKKVWDAILDDKTRPAHAEADGQEVGIDEPFDVDGEQLMYPKDDSLGASLKNIFGCRCDYHIILDSKND